MHPTSLAEWLELLERRHPTAIDLGLERCGAVWERLDSPVPGRRVITVAGTNGKGSAMAWLASLLAELGHSVAAYTSPHLLEFNERLRLDGQCVSDQDLLAAFEFVEEARGQESLTYYEFTTLACLWLMARAEPDFALLEVGLGGRLDTVNLVDADLVMIMPIGLDHQHYLGLDLETIGREKAGVMRRAAPVVCGEEAPPASIVARAGELDCPLYLPARDYHFQSGTQGIDFDMGVIRTRLPLPPLAGPHQPGNLAAALAAVMLISPQAAADSDALSRGVRNVQLSGRLQRVENDPRLRLDVGHNPLAAAAVAAWLDGQGTPACHCVLGMLADKDVEGVVQVLAGRISRWYCAGLQGARGQDAETLAGRVQSVDPQASVECRTSVPEALDLARARAGPDDLILVLGSFETVAAALRVCC